MCNTKQFTYDKETKGFFTCASDINYTGAASLILMSNRTGEKSEWVIQTVQRNSELEVLSFKFIPSIATLREHPGLAGHTLVIYND